MFTAALITIAKIWKQPKCPSTDEQVKKTLYYMYTYIYTQMHACLVVSYSL